MDKKIISYHKPEFKARLDNKLNELEQKSINSAQEYGTRNLPPPTNDDVKPYFEEIHFGYQELTNEVIIEIPFNGLVAEVVTKEQEMERQVNALNNELSAKKSEQIPIDTKINSTKPPLFSKKRMITVWIIVGAIGLFEGMMQLPVIAGWGYGFIEAILMAMFLGLALLVLAHLFKQIILLGKTVWQQRGIAGGLLITLICLFVFMATQRADLLSRIVVSDLGDGATVTFSPVPFIAISILLFIVSVAINVFYMPSKEQLVQVREYDALKKVKSDNELAQQKLEQAIENQKLELIELKKTNALIISYGAELEQLIISKAHSSFALWKKHNTMYRPDNGRPLSFDDTGYPFIFKTNFPTIKKLQS